MSRTPRTALMAMLRPSVPSWVSRRVRASQACESSVCSREESPKRRREDVQSNRRQGALLLRDGHDDLRLGRGLQDVLVAHDGGDDRGLGRVVGLEASQGGDRALEARVDRLQPKSGGPLENDGEKPFLYDGLRNN